MIVARHARVVLLDASVPHRFCDARLLPELITYLAQNAWVTPEVDGELRRSARSETYASLRLLEHAGWPKVTEPMPLALRPEYSDLLRAAQQPGDKPGKHAGEVTTVLMAQHLGAEVVVIDDQFGKALARRREIPRLSTAQLALEMVVEGHLAEDEGFAVFDCSTPADAGRSDYERAVAETMRRRGEL